MSNFAFLRGEWGAICEEASRAEHIAFADPRASCFYARRALELTLTWLFESDRTLRRPYQDDLSAMLFEPSLRTATGNGIHTKMDIIRRQGNAAVHRNRPVTPQESLGVVRELFHVMYWLARNYAHEPPPAREFDPNLIPRPLPASVRQQRQAELAALAVKYATQDAELARSREHSEALEAELVRLRAEVAAVKAVNQTVPDRHDYDEATTRDLFIDLLLREAGWPLGEPRDREFEVADMPNNRGKGFVDYVLWGDDGKPLALVEAKRTRRDATVGQQQAKLYADCLEAAFGQRPVIFYTNGYEHWIWDDERYPPRPVEGFYTKAELALLIQRRTTRSSLAGIAANPAIVQRHYQLRAIRRVGEAFEKNERAALLVMATGSGKTRTAVALVDELMRANWVKRVLFLVDRVALVKQTVNVFKTHLTDVTTVNLVTEKNTDGRVYVSTYPTMMGLINQTDDDQRRFGTGYFDLIVIDEAHRSVYQKYRAIFRYFDGLLLGLTATPKDEIDRNTYSLFTVEDGVPTDSYDLDLAVSEGYLVPPRAVSVPLKFQREGIRYDDLPDDEKYQWDLVEWDDDGDVPDAVTSDAVNKWLFNTDTVDKMLQTLMTQGHRVAGGDRLGKTIIFAKNNNHAQFIAKRFDVNYPEHRGTFARVITYQTEYAQTLIDDFSVRDKAPHIAISVDMLDTGIDVPEVVNLVFFKIVRSKTKFWQMIGRGTRLCPDLYGPGHDKTDFFVFDFCQNLEFFNQNMLPGAGALAEPLSQRLFKARVELVARLDSTSASGDEAVLRNDVAHHLHSQVEGMNLDNFVVRPQRRWVETYADFANWRTVSVAGAAEIEEHLSGLPTAVRDDDEQAKRFDMLMLRLQLCVLGAEPGFDRLRATVQEIASALLSQTNIPAVGAQAAFLDDIAGDDWWVDVTLPMLELVRRRVRDLVKLIEKSKRLVVFTDFADQLGDAAEVALSGLPSGDFERFRSKARMYLRAHEDHVALQKLRRNKPLTVEDLAELDRMLTEAGVGGASDIEHARRQSDGLGLFVRGLIGLDRAAAVEALDAFVTGKTLTANQLDFVSLVVEALTQNGVVDAGLLYASPFTELAPQGPESLFTSGEVDQLLAVLDSVRATAVPDDAVA